MTTHREILRIALPSIVANITVPLLGLVDLSIAGHLADASGRATMLLGAIAVGSLVFNMIYWAFGFLRIGCGGLTAQAYGRADVGGQRGVLRLGVAVGAAFGLALVALQWPIALAARWFVAPSAEVWALALDYFRIRIWAAPAVLVLFAVNGWFIGMQNSVCPMILAVVQNLINIGASCWFVFGCGMGIGGVALGTVVSQYTGLALAAVMVARLGGFGRTERRTTGAELRRFFAVNADVFVRTLLLIAVTSAVTAIGARSGDLTLAVNTLLMQLFTVFCYFTDGFAAAGEALTGKYVGRRAAAGDPRVRQAADGALRRVVAGLMLWGGGMAVVFTAVYWAGGLPFLGLLTDDAGVLAAAGDYLPWAVAIPLASFAAFVWDGIYIGATATRPMLAALAVGAAFFFGLYYGLAGLLPSNHRLWLAFIVYLAARGVAQTLMAPRVLAGRDGGG